MLVFARPWTGFSRYGAAESPCRDGSGMPPVDVSPPVVSATLHHGSILDAITRQHPTLSPAVLGAVIGRNPYVHVGRDPPRSLLVAFCVACGIACLWIARRTPLPRDRSRWHAASLEWTGDRVVRLVTAALYGQRQVIRRRTYVLVASARGWGWGPPAGCTRSAVAESVRETIATPERSRFTSRCAAGRPV